jgi:PAS domain S-box-containing protein
MYSRRIKARLRAKTSSRPAPKTAPGARPKRSKLVQQQIQALAAENGNGILELISDGIVAFDQEMNYIYVNQRGGELLGRQPQELIGKNYWTEYPEAKDTPFARAYARALTTQQTIVFEDYYPPWNRWFENRIYPSPHGIVIFFSEITERKLAEQLLRSELQVLELISSGAPLAQVLEAIVLKIETLAPRTRASILLLDPDGAHLRHGAAPHLPPEYSRAIDGMPIGPQEGSCGTAMYHGKPVVVSDIETDPLWDKYRELARQHGLRACWSTPVKNSDGRVLGSFAMYYPEPRSPAQSDFVLIERATHLAQIAIERKQAEERLQQQLKRISALHAIDLDILSSMDLASTLQSILERVTTQLEVDAAAVWLINPELDRLDLAAVRGFRRAEPLPQSRSLSQDLPQALLEHHLVVIPDLSQSKRPFSELPHIEGEGFVSYHGVCLTAKERPKGLLEIFRRSLLRPSSEWQDFLKTLAGQVAIAIDNAQLLEELQRSNASLQQAYETTIEGWSRALDLRDKETEGHSLRVTETTLRLARAAGMTEEELVHLRHGALLHDIGKMGVPDYILLKPGKLSEQEWALMSQHPIFAYELLSPIEFLRPALAIPYCHHEKWDGTGYPRGLRGEEIPLAARLFAVVDVWDALISERPYREAWPREKALAYMQEQAGAHFDPEVVHLFLKFLAEDDQPAG